MNKKTFKGLLMGLIIGSLVSTSLIMAAAGPAETRQITFGVAVALDGQQLQFAQDSQPFIMDGRKFLPVRAIADAVGLPVDFDASTNTVHLGNRLAGARVPLQQGAPFFDSGTTGFGHSASAQATSTVQMGGNSFNNAITYTSAWFTTGGLPGSIFSLHNLDGRYRQLTGQVGRVDGSGSRNAVLEIIGDDNVLQRIELDATALPVSFEVFVEGIRQLRIEVFFDTAHSPQTAYAVVAYLE